MQRKCIKSCRRFQKLFEYRSPWWTSQSTISIRFLLNFWMAYLAAIATLLKQQNPEAVLGLEWWPGGRMHAKPFRHLSSEHYDLICRMISQCIRPPGHHSSPSTASGFCCFNNVAIAAKYAIQKFNKKRNTNSWLGCPSRRRVLKKVFENDDRILYISLPSIRFLATIFPKTNSIEL